MFLLVSGRHVGAHPDGHQHGVSIQISINLGKTLLRITRELKTAETWFLAKLFILQSSIISQILEFIYWTVTIFSFDHMTDENREYYLHRNLTGDKTNLGRMGGSLYSRFNCNESISHNGASMWIWGSVLNRHSMTKSSMTRVVIPWGKYTWWT